MRRALLLSVVLVSGCNQASAPPAADTSGPNPVKARKEMSQLLSKADALTASVSAPPAAAPEPAPRPVASVSSVPVAPAPADSKPPAPAKPTADAVRDQALATFRDRLVTLRRTAEASRLKKDRYQQVCQGKVPQSECQQLNSDIAEASATIERELGDIEQAALRARIDSGAMHDLLARYGF
jgi:hypothetical protein